MRRLAAVAAAALLLVGCGTQTGGARSGSDPVPSGERPRAIPAADGPVQTRTAVTVMDTGRPELCLGGVAESYPPQCDGPPITNWDWADHDGHYEEQGGSAGASSTSSAASTARGSRPAG